MGRTLFAGAPFFVATSASLFAQVQLREVDLRQARVETVVPAEFDGGFLTRIGEIVVQEEGLWVLDNGQTKAFWFGHDGTLMQEYGRQGGGPGEFGMMGDLTVDSLVTIGDPRLGRAVRFRWDGTHVETTPHRRPLRRVFASVRTVRGLGRSGRFLGLLGERCQRQCGRSRRGRHRHRHGCGNRRGEARAEGQPSGLASNASAARGLTGLAQCGGVWRDAVPLVCCIRTRSHAERRLMGAPGNGAGCPTMALRRPCF